MINDVKKSMKSILKEIQSGKFAKEWVKEYQAGCNYSQLLENGEKHPIGNRTKIEISHALDSKKNIKGAQASYSIFGKTVDWMKILFA